MRVRSPLNSKSQARLERQARQHRSWLTESVGLPALATFMQHLALAQSRRTKECAHTRSVGV